MTNRFDFDATHFAGASRYLAERALQLLASNFCAAGGAEPLRDGETEWGCRMLFRRQAAGIAPGAHTHQAVYVYAQHRGRGHFLRHLAADPLPVVTIPDCGIEGYLKRHGVSHVVAGLHTQWDEYQAISTSYGDLAASRSGVLYMHHIDEGLAVMQGVGAGEREMRAFCLHPLVQADRDLALNFLALEKVSRDPRVLALAMEYRAVANATLSHREILGAEDIPLSVLPQVRLMLIGDKVQNYKDFLLHHSQTHPRRRELDRYFRLWLERLKVPTDRFEAFFQRLQTSSAPLPMPQIAP
jgi:hypothetical protein